MQEHYLKKELYDLVRSDARIFDFLQYAALDGLWYWNLEQPEDEWMNPKFWEVLGYDPAEMPHKASAWQEIIFAEDLKVATENARRHIEDPNHPYDQVVRYHHKEGYTVWIRCRGEAIRDESGRAVRMLGAHTDVTREKQAEINWQKEHATLQNILDKKSIYVIKTDMEGLYTYVNDYFCERLGISREEALGKMSTDYIIPEDHGKCGETVERCLAEPGKPMEVILRKPHPEGGFFTNFWEFTAITDEEGVPYEFLCVGRDISEQQQVETEISALFNISNDLLSVATFEGYLEHLNPKWEELTGYTIKELQSQHFLHFVCAEDRERTREAFQKLTEGKESLFKFENRYRKKDGSHLWLEWNSIPDAANQKIYSVARNITQRRQQAQLREKVSSSLLRISQRSILHEDTLAEFLRNVAREAAETLNVNRFSVWMYEESGQAIRCVEEVGEVKRSAIGERVLRSEVPEYFNAFEQHRVLSVSNTKNDPRTTGLADYLGKHGVMALLDVQVNQGNAPLGVLCAEHQEPREWLYEEESYISTLAELVATAYIAQQQQKSEQKYRMLAENSSDGIATYNTNYELTYYSAGLARMLGYKKSELGSALQNIKTFIHPEDQAYVLEQAVEAEKKKLKTISLEYRIKHKQGHYIWVEDRVQRIYDEEGSFVKVISTMREVTRRKQTEQALRESEDRYRSAVDTLSEGLVVQDMSDKVLMANTSAAQILGLSTDQLFGKTSMSPGWQATRLDGTPLPPTEHPSQVTIRTGEPVDNFLMNVHTGEGERRIISINTRPIRNENGEMYRVVASFTDVTAERNVLQELQMSNKFLSLAQKAAKVGHYRFFPLEDRWECSQALYEIFSISKGYPQTLSGWTDLIHPGDRQATLSYMQQEVLGQKQPFQRRYRIINQKTKAVRWVEGNGKVIENEAGEVVEMFGTIQDVTEQQQREQALVEARETLQRAADNIPGMIYQYELRKDGTDGLLFTSQGVEDLFEKSMEQFEKDATILWTRVHPEDVSKVVRSVRESAETLNNWEIEFRLQMPDGRVKWVSGRGVPKRLASGNTMWNSIALDITKQKKAEIELSKSTALLNSINQNINEGIYRSDKAGLIYVNAAFAHIFGYDTIEDILNADTHDFYESARQREELQQELIEKGSLIGKEVRFFRKDGTAFWASVNMTYTKDAEGNQVFDGAIRDITARKRAEQALAESEARYREIAETVPGAVLRYQLTAEGDYQMLYASQNAENIWELSPEEIISDPRITWFMVRKPFRKPIERRIQASIHTLKEWSYEWQIETPSGKVKWLSGIGVPKQKDDGSIVWSTLFLDITERKTMEEEVQRLANVAQRTVDIILTCDEEGVITWCNTAIETMLGLAPEDVIGYKPTAKLTGADTNLEYVRQLEACLIQKKVFNETLRLYHSSGEARWINYETTPVFDKAGVFLYTIVVKRDLTDLIEKQQELKELLQTATEQNKRLREFSYITSHNIRSSVANLLGLTELLNSDPGNPKYIEMINRSTNRLDKTIKNINALLQVEQGTKPLEKAACQIQEVVERAIAQNSRLIEEQSAQIELQITPEHLNVYAVPVYLDSIVQNLITNALKYGITFMSQKIEIRAYHRQDTTYLEVKDYGHGIDMEKNGHRLFQLGTRLHDISGGQGLGLYMSKRQAEALGGTIEVESRLNQGTTFRLCLPGFVPQ